MMTTIHALLLYVWQEAFKEGKAAKQAKEEYEWGRGLVQKEKDAEFRKELEDIKNAPFARLVSRVVGVVCCLFGGEGRALLHQR